MIFLDSFVRADGSPASPADFNQVLLGGAAIMYERGWTIIGSRFKLPNLHPWKALNRNDLFYYAQSNLATLRANSLNLRLSDTSTIALDCDFNDPELMHKFVDEVMRYLNIPKHRLFTASGKKGGKLFFTYQPSGITDKPPRSLGPTVFIAGHTGEKDFKQELEVKSDLSTIAGLYGLNEQGRMMIYGPYEDFPYITQATPKELVRLTSSDLEAIGNIYKRLVTNGGYVNDLGIEQINLSHRDVVLAGVFYFYFRIWTQMLEVSSRQNKPNPEPADVDRAAYNSPYYWRYIKPMYECLGLEETCKLIEYLFCTEKPVLTYEQLIDVDRLQQALSIKGIEAQRVLVSKAGFFKKQTDAMTQRFYALGAKYGFNNLYEFPEVMFSDVRKAMDAAASAAQEAECYIAVTEQPTLPSASPQSPSSQQP